MDNVISCAKCVDSHSLHIGVMWLMGMKYAAFRDMYCTRWKRKAALPFRYRDGRFQGSSHTSYEYGTILYEIDAKRRGNPKPRIRSLSLTSPCPSHSLRFLSRVGVIAPLDLVMRRRYLIGSRAWKRLLTECMTWTVMHPDGPPSKFDTHSTVVYKGLLTP